MLAHAAFTEVFECLLAEVDWFSLHIRPTTNCYGVTQQVDLQPRNRYEMPFLRGAENARYQQIQLWWFLNIVDLWRKKTGFPPIICRLRCSSSIIFYQLDAKQH